MSELEAKQDLPIKSKSHHMKLDEILKEINALAPDDRVQVAQKLLGHDHGLTVVLGGHNVINNSFVLQLNGSVDEISNQLKELPAETLEELLKAIAIRISQDKI